VVSFLDLGIRTTDETESLFFFFVFPAASAPVKQIRQQISTAAQTFQFFLTLCSLTSGNPGIH